VTDVDLSSSEHLLNAESLKRAIHQHLLDLGFSKNSDRYFIDGEITKQKIRDLHSVQRHEVLDQNLPFIKTYGPELVDYLATGKQVDPTLIDPELCEVKTKSLESRLFTQNRRVILC
jgi:hypothetical protein